MPSGAETWWRCWHDIQNDRPIGMDVGPIPWTVVDRWAVRHGIDDIDTLWDVIGRLDAVWREWWRSRQPAPGK